MAEAEVIGKATLFEHRECPLCSFDLTFGLLYTDLYIYGENMKNETQNFRDTKV